MDEVAEQVGDSRGSAVLWRRGVHLNDATACAAAAAARRSGISLSSWLNRAADYALRVEEGLRAVAAWEAEHGALTASELAAADRFLAVDQRQRAS